MNQLRKNTKFTSLNHVRFFYQKYRLGGCGAHIFFDKNVQLMRNPKKIFLDDDIMIKEGTKICACNTEAEVRIGKNTSIGYHNFLFASNKILIGQDCMLAPFVYIVDSNHSLKKGETMNRQVNVTAPIVIGDDVWIASNVTILKGVTIGDGAVIAANSVLNTDVPAYTIFGGTPARKIGERE